MAKNAFVKITALNNVRGRINYVTSPEEQEHLEAYCDNMPQGGWAELAKYSRKQSALYHPGEKVCEARELIIKMQNDLSRFDPLHLAITLRDEFSKKYKVPCAVAIHWNKAENNYHAHLIFSERSIYREKKGESIATRNTYFDADGKRSTKKECLDENGNLKEGCRLVKKGEALSEGSRFGAKKNIFAQEEWLRQEKERLVSFMNANTKGEKWQVYDWKTNPHLPYMRLVKGEPEGLTAWKKRQNDLIRDYNENIDILLAKEEITPEQALKLKFEHIRISKQLAEERKQARLLAMENWDKFRARSSAEREFQRSLKNKSTLELLCILILMKAGVDVVKLQTGIEKPAPYNKKVTIYPDKQIQDKIDAIYIATGKLTPSQLALKYKAERLTHQQDGDLNSLMGDAQRNKGQGAQKGSNFNDKDKDRVNTPEDR